MEITKIPQADILDIIFDGRNKEYGAYDLRKSYNRRLTKSLALTGSVCLLLIGSYVVAGKMDKSHIVRPQISDVIELAEVHAKEKPIEIPPPAPKLPPQQVATKIFAIPKIVPKDQVKPDEVPPNNDELDKVKIGTVNQNGNPDGDIVAPPAGTGTGVTEAPVQKENVDEIFRKVEIESYYAPGPEAWKRLIGKNFNPDKAIEAGLTGTVTVVVQFIVDLDGNVSDIEAVSGPEELRQEAIRVIKKSGRWEPAIQNGRKVKSYKKQPITVQVTSE
jgi:periplasmic protein TonB